MLAKYILFLYHGTNNIYSRRIMQDGFKLPEAPRKDHWLGNGIYFFREDQEQARLFALHKFKDDDNSKQIHVLGTKLEIGKEKVLNLDSRDGMNRLRTHVREFKELLRKSRVTTKQPKELRHLVMGLLPKEYNVIIRTFCVESIFDKDQVFQLMDLRLQGTQVCVRQERAITGEVGIVHSERLKTTIA